MIGRLHGSETTSGVTLDAIHCTDAQDGSGSSAMSPPVYSLPVTRLQNKTKFNIRVGNLVEHD